jgi:hypothetical protein
VNKRDERMNAWSEDNKEGREDGRTGGRTDGQMGERKQGKTGGGWVTERQKDRNDRTEG